uniref:Uncharacterized protein n=1 Tax=Anopheles coluzzii TaxID=1518534 RepID=A0A8W7PHK4_ANOCL
MLNRRLPPPPAPPAFFSDLVLTTLVAISFGASALTCLLQSLSSSSVDRRVRIGHFPGAGHFAFGARLRDVGWNRRGGMGSWITGYGSYLVGTALSSNGSKVAVMRCTPFRLTSFSCLPMADTMPPDRRNAPPTLMDIVTLEEV